MGTVAAPRRDANAFDENPLKTMSENPNYETDFPFRQVNCYMLPITTTLHLEGHARN